MWVLLGRSITPNENFEKWMKGMSSVAFQYVRLLYVK
jgi:hypothetical protein